MFRKKLQSLDYYNVDNFDVSDVQQFRQTIAWLEDQKIRHYKIEDRQLLRRLDDTNWDHTFQEYLSSIDCPFSANQTELVLDWILTLAVRLEYEDNIDKYNTLTEQNLKKEPQVIQSNPIDNLDFESNEFKDGIKELAQFLKVPTHPTDQLLTLKAICVLIKKLISNEESSEGSEDEIQNESETEAEANERIREKKREKQRQKIARTGVNRRIVEESSIGFKIGSDKVLSSAAKIVRLLYVKDLRELQTKINQMIVSVQSLTANPKTDSTKGQVGK